MYKGITIRRDDVAIDTFDEDERRRIYKLIHDEELEYFRLNNKHMYTLIDILKSNGYKVCCYSFIKDHKTLTVHSSDGQHIFTINQHCGIKYNLNKVMNKSILSREALDILDSDIEYIDDSYYNNMDLIEQVCNGII